MGRTGRSCHRAPGSPSGWASRCSTPASPADRSARRSTAGAECPSTAATAAPTAAPVTAAMLIAVADRVFLRTPMSGAEYGECDSASDFSACPVTPRLLGRLEQHPISGGVGGAAPFCRCQNFWPTQSITATPAAGGGVAHVTIFGTVVSDL